MAKVLLTCGEPSKKESSEGTALGTEQWIIEKWIYDFGDTNFLYILTFQNRTLENIESEQKF